MDMKSNLISEHEEILQYRALLENIQGGIVISEFEPPFHLRFVTEGLCKMSGYSEAELLSMVQMDIVHPDDIEPLTEDVIRQFSIHDVFEVEYRLLKKDHSFIHVLDRAKVVIHSDGKKYIHCLMTDITEHKKMEEHLKLSEEKYKAAIEQSDNVIIEYEPDQDLITFSENYKDIFRHTIKASRTLDQLIKSSWVYHKDVESLKALFKQLKENNKPFITEFRITKDGLTPIWCSLSIVPLFNSDHQMYHAVGRLQNINAKKQELQTLISQAQRDPLINTLNRKYFEKQMMDYINKVPHIVNSVLWIIDVDDFKLVNDTMGHAFGDFVLKELANTMLNAIPENALLGRFGGDEMGIFIKDVNENELEDTAKEILFKIHETFKDCQYEYGISVSIGGAVYKENQTFKEIYNYADHAMYKAKQNGKNQFYLER